jgi:pyruvate dehydrogenase (quinone)
MVILVLNNSDLNEVTWEQRAMAGDPRYERSQSLPEFPFAQYAQMLGLQGIRVSSPEQVRPAWEQALASKGPVVYEALTDPNMPPLPPELHLDTARNMGRAFVRGDTQAREVLTHTLRTRVGDLTSR